MSLNPLGGRQLTVITPANRGLLELTNDRHSRVEKWGVFVDQECDLHRTQPARPYERYLMQVVRSESLSELAEKPTSSGSVAKISSNCTNYGLESQDEGLKRLTAKVSEETSAK